MKPHFRGKNASLSNANDRFITDMIVSVTNFSFPEKTANPFLAKYLQGYLVANQKELAVKVVPSEIKNFSKLVNLIGKFGQPTTPIQIKGNLDATFFAAGADQPPLIVVYLKNIEKVVFGAGKEMNTKGHPIMPKTLNEPATGKLSSGDQICQANMRVILGGIEMYNMDHVNSVKG